MDILEVARADLKGATMERQRQVAEAAGVPWSTLRKIVDGDTENPRYDTVKALADYYERHPVGTGLEPPPDHGPLDPDAITGLPLDGPEART